MSQSFNAELWRQADTVLDGLLDLPADERLPRLAGMDLADEVRSRVRRLLAGLEKSGPLDAGSLTLLGMEVPPAAQGMEGREIGPYRLESLIGQGGMSAVYRARRTDGSYDTPVAVKILNSALLATDWKERFRREARYLAQLRHPGIATLLDAGVSDDGTPYLVTELVDGRPIHQHCHDTHLDIRARVGLMHQLCEAVAFAQKRLIVHRDIKPENVMVTADGRVKLMDFGIAKPLAEDGEELATVTRVFTPEYAAPEQLAGEPATTASDVFSLGAVFYHLLTGESPFARTSGGRAAGTPVSPPSKRTITRDELPAAERKQRARLLRGDLDNIVRKALEETPERRYPNAQDLGNDLKAWLEHRPVSAHAPALSYRARLFAKRRPALTSALAALLLVGGAGLAATLWQAREAQRQAELAHGVTDYLVTVFTATDPRQVQADDPRASELLRRGSREAVSALDDNPAVAAELLRIIGSMQRHLGFFDDAAESLSTALERAPHQRGSSTTRSETMMELAVVTYFQGRPEDALSLYRQGLDSLPRRLPADDPRHIKARIEFPQLMVLSDPAAALQELPALRDIAGDQRLSAELRLGAMKTVGIVLDGNRRGAEAEKILRTALDLASHQPGVSPLEVSEIGYELGLNLLARGLIEDSRVELQRVLEIERQHYEPGHPRLAAVLYNLGDTLFYGGNAESALSAYEDAARIGESAYATDHPFLLLYRARPVGPLWALERWNKLDEKFDELGQLPLQPSARYWVNAYRLLSLQSRERWKEAAMLGSEILNDELTQLLPQERRQLLLALTAWSWISAGETARGAPDLEGIELPSPGPLGWRDQLLCLTMVKSHSALGQTNAADRWQERLEEHGTVMPVLQSLAETRQ